MASQIGSIKPLRDYLNDKKEMIEQMFSCIEDHQLKKMIPDILKEVNIEDIKAECLVELLGMSRKRIVGILEGKELDESSEDSLELSDISDVEIQVKKERKSPDKTKKRKGKKETKGNKSGKKTRKESSSESDDNTVEDESEKEETPPKKKKLEPKKKKKVEISPPKEPPPKKAVKELKKKTDNISKDKEKQSKVPVANLEAEVEVPKEKEGGKNLLEILELEMRARAIRSLIEREEKKNKDKPKGPQPSTSDNNIDDCDPDAVIVIDEATEEIDLTKNDSDSEEANYNNNKNKTVQSGDSNKAIEDDVVIIIDKDDETDKNEGGDNGSGNPSVKEPNSNQTNQNNSQENKTDNNSSNSVPKSWTERWLESNNVQKVMKTSKVMTNLKKRLINVNKQKSIEEKNSEAESQSDIVIEGTVNEFFHLPSNRKKNTDKDTNGNKGDDGNEEEVTDSNTHLTTSADVPSSNIEDEIVYSLSFDKLPVSSDNNAVVTVATCAVSQDVENDDTFKSEPLVEATDNPEGLTLSCENRQYEIDEGIVKGTERTETDGEVLTQKENVDNTKENIDD